LLFPFIGYSGRAKVYRVLGQMDPGFVGEIIKHLCPDAVDLTSVKQRTVTVPDQIEPPFTMN
jgi:hypothetical protein